MQYATVIYKNSLTGISDWKAAHMKYNFIHNYDLVDVSHHDKICPFQKYS